MVENFVSRAATLEDLDVLLSFEQGIILAERPYDCTLKKDPITYYDLKELILSKDSEVVVALHGTKIVGSGYALIKQAKPYLRHKKYAYLGFMYTAPEYRGKGINKEIMKALKKWARTNRLTELRLTVYNDNAPAIKAYEKVGFKAHILEMRMDVD
ncbi:Ribosomal protein S18 acetylase RimI [Arenibacter nanhaiticus]|uniref:Ribosomal protein S18 acetylase RimI n=1 Tax=Arenibacter nanhaiticus TaxID=558155 RepID=A0A1M6H5U8_9FLAO|nr:GNAT family N-acetyltransferase [Arenibacter nanhaiticus]SHJ17546.1 Ribosomal protein S18 acetylase RimI [Arenibacter nanhaiticus]